MTRVWCCPFARCYLRLIGAVLRPPSGEVTRMRFGLMLNVLVIELVAPDALFEGRYWRA